ncbi:MAG TPA: glycosyltransferase family 2 protein, partial [Methanomicrobia archaeon]|nr:glycosyltransferase family 2 protein [Methanomicrobia archaeon]
MDVVGALVSVVMGYNVVVFAYFILLNAFYLLIFLLSTDQLLYFLQRSRSVEQFDDPTLMYPSISIIVPAYNEEKTIVASVKSFLEN